MWKKDRKNETSRQSDMKSYLIRNLIVLLDNLVQDNLVVEPGLDSCLAIDLMYANYYDAKYYWD